jgi:hypothetical protein
MFQEKTKDCKNAEEIRKNGWHCEDWWNKHHNGLKVKDFKESPG